MKDRLVALLAAAFGFIVYALTAHPFPDWLDSPELMSAAFRLGVFHPPGSPLAVITGHLFSLYPLAPPATSLLCFSACFAAGCVYVLSRTIGDLWRSLGPRSAGLEAVVVTALAVAFVLGNGLWSQAVRTEVYTLALFLFLCSLRELLRIACAKDENDPRRIYRAAAFCGMGLCVHPLMALSVAPGIALLAALKNTRGLFLTPRHLVRSAAAFLLGAAPLLLIPLMVRAPGDLRWGDPTTFTGWLETVSGLTFHQSFSPAQAAVGHKALIVVVLSLGAGLSVLAALGLYPFMRKKLAAALLLILTGAASVLTLALQRSVRLDNPDVFGYALPAVAVAFLLAAGGLSVGARLLFRLRARLAWMAAALSLLALLANLVLLDWQRVDRSGCHAGRHLAMRALEGLPENTLVVASDFNLVFMLDYLIQVEGLRPDVRVLFLRDLSSPKLRTELSLPGPGLDRDFIEKVAATRPLALDIGPHLDEGALIGLRPRGLLWLAAPPDAAPEAELVAGLQSFYQNLAPPICRNGRSADPQTADVVAWHAYWQTQAAIKLGLFDLARELLTVAGRASPQDGRIAALARRMGVRADDRSASPAQSLDGPPARRPALLPAFLLLIGLIAWALPLFLSGYASRRWMVSLAGFLWMGMVIGLS